MPNIGPTELIIVLVIVLVIFGPKRLPQLGRQLGGGMREFKNSITSKDDSDDATDEAEKAPLAVAPPVEQPPAPAPVDTPAVVDAADAVEVHDRSSDAS